MTPIQYHLGQFPPNKLDWQRLLPLIGQAREAVDRYDGILTTIPNKHVLLSPLITQEAVLSSKIEGSHVTVGEVLEYEAGSPEITGEKHLEAEEVLNYRKALLGCVDELREKPFTLHLLRAAHAELMEGVRGKEKSPGSFRKEQNWIGMPNSTIETASFIPIAPEQLMPALEKWIQYVNDTSQPDVLVQTAITHLEFEALHPFKDGNGRVGRMIIPLFLFHRKLLQSPDFYMSEYFEANRDAYIESMRTVSRDGDWTQWCEFFLKGVTLQAKKNQEKAQKILDLYNELKLEMADLTHSQYAIKAVDFIFRSPIFTTAQFIEISEIPKPSAARIMHVMTEKGIIIPLREAKGRRPGLYSFGRLLKITEVENLLLGNE